MSWHGEHRAVCVFSFDVDAESPILAHSANYADHAMTMTHQAYGPRVGVRRILAMLAEYDLKATFFVPGLTAERYPHVVEAALSGGHEVAHHSYSHRNASTMAPGDERADFERALKVLQAQGAELKGHRAGLWEASWETPGLVAEYGLLYDSSLMDDDRPYVIEVGDRKIAELPPHWSLDETAHHAVDFWLTTEDLPKPANRVTVDRDGRVHLAYTATNDAEADGLYQELRKILNHVGLAAHHILDKNFYMSMDVAVAGVAHQAGTCRFGADPATSVLDVNCKAHELDNLYVVDTSVFPSIGAVNPALTAMANAIRVGEHLLSRMA